MNNAISGREGFPNHIGIIVDGNRRWAKEKRLPTFSGHKKGNENRIDINNELKNDEK